MTRVSQLWQIICNISLSILSYNYLVLKVHQILYKSIISNTQVISGQTEWDPDAADQVAVPLCCLLYTSDAADE